MTDMREKVARAIADANGIPNVEDWMIDAQAAITALWPLFVDEAEKECGRVALVYRAHSQHDQALAAEDCAAAIRNLEPPQ